MRTPDKEENALLQSEMRRTAEKTEAALRAYTGGEAVPEEDGMLSSMRYSLLGGGKRLRPFLTLTFARLFAEKGCGDEAENAALPFAAALEMIHTYSLIHDDLPCMDNDDLRRGKPSNHKVYGQAGAVLAGDGLLTLAFQTAADNPLLPPETVLAGIRLLARCAGPSGMVRGQVLDMENERCALPMTAEKLDATNDLKTGALLRAACLLGTLAAGARNGAARDAAERYAFAFGRAFQITDDLLDVTGDSACLGKTAGKDAAAGKITYPALFGVEACREKAASLAREAAEAVRPFPGSETLVALAEYLLTRSR